MDGTSGALYAIFLNALSHSLRTQPSGDATPAVWATALRASLDALGRYTPARPGDRTLVDALAPFVDVLGSSGELRGAAEAALKGAEGTRGMKASLGRAVYVGGEGFEAVPDPGAWGLAVFFAGLAGVEVEAPSGSVGGAVAGKEKVVAERKKASKEEDKDDEGWEAV